MLHLLFSRHPVRDTDYDPRVGFLKEFLTRLSPTAPVTLMLENRGNGMPLESKEVWQLFKNGTCSDEKTNDWMMDLARNAPDVDSTMSICLERVFNDLAQEFRQILAQTPDALLEAKPSIGNVVRAERDKGRQMSLVVESPTFRAWLCGAAMCANITLAQQHLQNGDLEGALAACGHQRVLVNRMMAESDPSIAKQLASLDH